MEIYIQLIFVLAIAKYCLKAALTGRFWTIILYGVIAAIIGIAIYPIVIEQPVNIIPTILLDHALVANGAVITTIEAISGIFVSVFLLDNYFMHKKSRKKSMFILKVVPGLLSILAIAYFELMFFKMRVGDDFMQTAILYCVIVFTTIVAMSTAFRYLLKAENLKLELKVLLNTGILIIGLLVNATIADYNLSQADIEIEWKAMAALAGVVTILFFAGIYISKINIKSLYKNSFKWNK